MHSGMQISLSRPHLSCMELVLQAVGGDLMVWEIYFRPFSSSRALFKHHIPCEYCCQQHPSLYDYNILIFCIQHCYMPCHKSQIILNRFLWHENELTVLKWPWKSSDCYPIEQFWDVAIRVMDVQMCRCACSWDPCHNVSFNSPAAPTETSQC